MLSIEQLTIDAYIVDGEVLCRKCGEKVGLPMSQALCRYSLWSEFSDGISCGDCGEELVPYSSEDENED